MATIASGHEFLAQTPETFSYDLDGNLTADGQWTYVWDAENRLISMVARTSIGPQRKLDFEYDWHSRRIRKDVSIYNDSTFGYDRTNRIMFAYDGWNLTGTL